LTKPARRSTWPHPEAVEHQVEPRRELRHQLFADAAPAMEQVACDLQILQGLRDARDIQLVAEATLLDA
jgi:hypothetical protein